MITNIVASVAITLITNVVPSDNAVWETDFGVQYATYPGQWGQRIKTPATEQYLTTNVTERTSVTVQLSDGPHTWTVDKAISSVTAVLKKLENWIPAGLRTNDVSPKLLSNWTNNAVMFIGN